MAGENSLGEAKQNGARKLDLDALYGVAHTDEVTWQGKSYRVLRLDALSPRDWVKFTGLRTRVAELQAVPKAGAEPTDQQIAQLDEVLGEALRIIAPELTDVEMPFMARFKLLTWYLEQVQEGFGAEKKRTPRQRTMATRSRRSRSGTDSALAT